MSAKHLRTIALVALTLFGGAITTSFTINDTLAQAAAGGPNGGGNGGRGGGNGGRGGNDGSDGGDNDFGDRNRHVAMPIFALSPGCLTAATLCPPPPRRPPPRVKKENDGCGGYRPINKQSDPLIFDRLWRCDNQQQQ